MSSVEMLMERKLISNPAARCLRKQVDNRYVAHLRLYQGGLAPSSMAKLKHAVCVRSKMAGDGHASPGSVHTRARTAPWKVR